MAEPKEAVVKVQLQVYTVDGEVHNINSEGTQAFLVNQVNEILMKGITIFSPGVSDFYPPFSVKKVRAVNQ